MSLPSSQALAFKPATKSQRRARIFLAGPSGSGKTWTALTWARELGERIAFVDTEHGSATAYAGDFQFDHLDLTAPFTVERYIAAMNAAADAAYDVLIIDSLSHAWAGKGGLLELHEQVTRQSRSQDSFRAWGDVTPKHLEFIEAILSMPMHVIATCRVKSDYQVQQNERGRWEPTKLGLKPIQRDELDYEFDVVADMSVDGNILRVTKSRCSALAEFAQTKPDGTLAKTLREWLSDGAPLVNPDRPTAAQVAEHVTEAADETALRELWIRAKSFHLLPSVTEAGPTIEQLIDARLQELRRTPREATA